VLPTYVALVPLEDDRAIPVDHLADVAAALQIQVVRDLRPIWHVTGTVSAFARLEELPAGYVPLAVTRKDLPLHRRGFHFTLGGLPFGVVQYREDDEWPVAASHELLELFCDPSAQRTVLAPSLADEKDRAINPPGPGPIEPVIEGEPGRYTRQGLVNYLIEVCDPCEESTYEINGVKVSDFVTPAYYDARAVAARKYSFRETVSRPLGVLEGGSLSWRPVLPQTLVYQAHADSPAAPPNGSPAGDPRTPGQVEPRDLEIRKVVDGSSGLAISSQRSSERAASLAPTRTYHTTHTSWGGGGASLRSDLEELLGYLSEAAKHPAPSIDEIISLLEEIVEHGGYSAFNADPKPALDKLGLEFDPAEVDAAKTPTMDEYRQVLEFLKQQKKVAGIFGPDLTGNKIALWLCMQIG
jgi:hypothetical protein